jgi:organic radical activating enzyme
VHVISYGVNHDDLPLFLEHLKSTQPDVQGPPSSSITFAAKPTPMHQRVIDDYSQAYAERGQQQQNAKNLASMPEMARQVAQPVIDAFTSPPILRFVAERVIQNIHRQPQDQPAAALQDETDEDEQQSTPVLEHKDRLSPD